MKTLKEWERHIELKWLESIGTISTEAASWLEQTQDFGYLFFQAVSKYRRAHDEGNERKRPLLLQSSAKAAGEFVRIAVERGRLDSIRNLHCVMKKIEKGGRAKVDGHAKSVVGLVLRNFIWEMERLPNDRKELRERIARSKPDPGEITPRHLAAALEYYSLNDTIRDKTGPKPAK